MSSETKFISSLITEYFQKSAAELNKKNTTCDLIEDI